MSNPPEMTERQKLCRALAKARRYHRFAVRWLFDVSRLTSMYREEDRSWRGAPDDDYGQMAEVARQDYDDAVKEVIQTRKLVDRAAKKLKDYDDNERHIRESD